MLERDGDAARLVLAATYGLLVTSDRGAEWRHLCELGFAFSVDDIDPLLELPADGSMLAKGGRSLNRAPDPFCEFEPVLGESAGQSVADFTLDRQDRSRVLALVLERGDGGVASNRVYESLDSGESFALAGAPLPEDAVLLGLTIDVAPSDENRLYVSATGDRDQSFARSDDGGASWTVTALALEAAEYPYIAAVHPADPDVVYLRTDHWISNEDGTYRAGDRLFYSEDGGRSFIEIHGAPGKLLGFALAPDGGELLVAYGDPVEPSRSVDADALGIYHATSLDHAFTKIFDGSVSCLAWTENGVYACTSQAERGFALGFSTSADFDLDETDPFTPLLELPNVAGPLDCPACTSIGSCRELWSENCVAFGNCADGAAAVGGTDCSAAGSGADAGGPASSGGGGGAAGSPGRDRPDPKAPSSCGCRVPGRPGSVSFAWWLVLALAWRARRDALRRGRL